MCQNQRTGGQVSLYVCQEKRCEHVEKRGHTWSHLDLRRPMLCSLTRVQGGVELSEMSNIGPSACFPWVPCHLCPTMCSPVAYIPKSVAAKPTLSICLCQICQCEPAVPAAAPPPIQRGYSCTAGFPHLFSKLSPPQKESAVLPASLNCTSSSAGPRQLTLLCNHHYPHNCLLSKVKEVNAQVSYNKCWLWKCLNFQTASCLKKYIFKCLFS